MTDRGCDLFCFRECGDKYETHVMKKDIEGSEKLSLKRMNSVYANNHLNRKPLQKIKSVTKMEQLKCPTDRSNQSMFRDDELNLLRKKMELERQLVQVNESISMISSRYRSKIQKLQDIRRQMGTLLYKRQ